MPGEVLSNMDIVAILKQIDHLRDDGKNREAADLIDKIYARRSFIIDIDLLIEVYRKKCVYYLLKKDLETARALIDDMYEEMEKRHSVTLEGACCSLLALYMQKMQCYTESVDILKKSIELFMRENRDSHLGMAYTDLSASYFHMGNYAQSAAMLEMAIPLLEQQSEKAYLMRALTSASAACIRLNDYQRALEYGLRALSLKEQQKVKSGIRATLLNIGMIYSEIDMLEKARSYYLRAVEETDPFDGGGFLARVYNNLGNLELSCNNTEAALEYYRKSLAIKEKLGDLSSIAFTYLNIGQLYAEDYHDLDMAESFLQKALGMFMQCEQELDVARTKHHLASVALLRNNLAEAERLLSEAMETAEKHRAVGFLKEFNGMAVILHTARGDEEAARAAENRRKELEDLILSEEKKNAIKDTEMKYQRDLEQQGSVLVPRCFDLLRRRP